MGFYKKNKLLLPVAFAGLVLLPALLVLCLQAAQYGLKQTSEERLERQRLHILYLPEASVRWEKKNRELKIEGRFFDVTHLERRGSMLVITGHYDDLETDLSHFLQKALTHSRKNGAFSRLVLMLQCLVALPLIIFYLPPINLSRYYQIIRPAFYLNPFIGIAPQPPWARILQSAQF